MPGGAFTYERVYARLKEQIERGEYSAGSRLPSERMLAAQLGVSRNTLRQALRKLREEGIVEPERGSGVYVQARVETRSAARAVGVLIPDLSIPLHQQFLDTFTALAQSRGLVTALAVHRDADDEVSGALAGLLKLDPDVVVVEPTRNLSVPLFDELDLRGTPRILLVRDHPDMLCDKVVVDNVEVGRAATRLLIDYGCKDPIFVGPLDYLTAWDRLCGYRQALMAAGRTFRPEFVLDATRGEKSLPETGADLVDRLLDEGGAFDGVVAFNDTFARNVIDRLRSRGIDVPGDVAVVGVDDLPASREGEVPITTITFDGRGAAGHVFELIERRLEGRELYPVKRTIGIHAIGRASCPI